MKNIFSKIAFLFLLIPVKAYGVDFEICNGSKEKVYFGYAYYKNSTDKYWSRGWWSVEGGNNCKTINVGNVDKISVFAKSAGPYMGGSTKIWGGDYPFCAESKAFEIGKSHSSAKSKGSCGNGRYRVFAQDLDKNGNKFSWKIGDHNLISSHYNLCNKTDQKVWFSEGMWRGKENKWTSKGWYDLEAGECSLRRIHEGIDVHPSVSGAKRYFFYAHTQDGNHHWQGDSSFCIKKSGKHEITNTDKISCSESDRGKVSMVGLTVASGIKTHNLTLGSAKPRLTKVKFCNNANSKVSFAYARYIDEWTSEGWWGVEPGVCKTHTITGAEKDSNNYYKWGYRGSIYISGSDKGWETMWGADDSQFCVSNKAFKLKRSDNCSDEGRKYYSFGKFEVKPGQNSYNFSLASGKKRTKLKWCNDNSFAIYGAYLAKIEGYDGNSSHGWYKVEPNSCKDISLWSTKNLPFKGQAWLYANNGALGKWNWGNSSKTFCTHVTKTFQWSNGDTKSCDSDAQVLVRSQAVNLDYGTNQFNFSESNAVPLTTMELCNETDQKINAVHAWKIGKDGPGSRKKGWRTKGSYLIEPRKCNKIHISDYNGYPFRGQYALFAMSVGSTSHKWTGPLKLCVKSGRFVQDQAEKGSCDGGVKVGFAHKGYIMTEVNKLAFKMTEADPTTLKMCNRSQKTLNMAYAYLGADGLRSFSLPSVGTGGCEFLPLRTKDGIPFHGKVHVFAEDGDGNLYSQGYKEVCISSDGSEISGTAMQSCDGEGQRKVLMRDVHVNASQTTEVKFDDQDALAKTKLELCNNTSENIRAVVVSYSGTDEGFRSQGWYALKSKACRELEIATPDGRPYNGNVALYGKGEFLDYGEGFLRFCVNFANESFEIPHADTGDCKNSNLRRVEMALIQVKAESPNRYEFSESRLFD